MACSEGAGRLLLFSAAVQAVRGRVRCRETGARKLSVTDVGAPCMLAVAKPEFDAGGMEPRVSLELQVEVLHVGYASAMESATSRNPWPFFNRFLGSKNICIMQAVVVSRMHVRTL